MRSPSEWAADPRLEGPRRWLARYHPFLTTILAVALIAIFLPGRSTETTPEGVAGEIAAGGAPIDADQTGPASTAITGAQTKSGGPTQATVNPNVLSFEEARKRGVELVPNCDQSTGRIMMPTRFAPPCTQKYGGRNGGKTWQGVDEKTIKVAYMIVRGDPASEAILQAAGVNDSDENIMKQVRDYGTMYESHFNMWGRKIEWHFLKPSGDADDDAAAKADAIKVATEIKAFAAVNSINNSFANELVARRVMCFCTVSQPIETYIKWSPYVWTSLLASTQGYIHRAQYTGGRLANKNAKWAYDDINPTQGFKSQKRKFGFLYYETDDFAFKSGAEFFIRYMKEKYGITFAAVSSYHGYPQVQRTQEEARPIIQRMKEAGVTSLLCACDPFGPVFFTQEATRQLYGPEWVITGSALTDTSFFGRLYDQDQWSHAFGISYLPARMPEELGAAYRLYRWHFDRTPPAEGTYGVIHTPIALMYNGYHTAGPVLTPETFRTGMYNQPITGRGSITERAQSYGDKGLWPWKEDPVQWDDVTEIWWDRSAEGEDEIGQDGRGLYRYVDGGKRYLPGEHPTTDPRVFDPKGTVTIYEKPPPQDQWPCYPSPATKKKDRC